MNDDDDDRDDAVVWMLLLERGRRTGDFELAARAKRELLEMGIKVSYGKRKLRNNATVDK